MPTNQSDKDDERSGLRLFGYLAAVIAIVCAVWGVIDAVNSISKDEYNVSEMDKATHSADELRSMYLWTLILFVIPFLLSAILLILGIHMMNPFFLWPFILLICVQAVLAVMAILDDFHANTAVLAFLRGGICVLSAYFINRLRKSMIEEGKGENTNYMST